MDDQGMAQVQIDAVLWARDIMMDPGVVYLDSETTGVSKWSEIIDLAIINQDGNPLFDALIKPINPIPYEATRIHGIDDYMVKHAMTFPEAWEQIGPILGDVSRVVIYNADFDTRMIEQDVLRHGLEVVEYQHTCAMRWYARLTYQWNPKKRDWKWIKLGDALARMGIDHDHEAHRALADTYMTRDLIKAMSDVKLDQEDGGFRQLSLLPVSEVW